MATRWVYRARYFSTTAGPPNGGCEYTTQSVAYSPRTHASNAAASGEPERACPAANAARSRARNLPRNTRLSTRTGRKNPGRHDRHRPSGVEPAAGGDAVDVGVVRQRLPPGVQHQQQPDLGPQVLRVRRHLPDRLGGRRQQGVVHRHRVEQPDRVHLGRQGEHDVVVLDRQQVPRLPGQPRRLLRGTALRAVAVAARVVGDPPCGRTRRTARRARPARPCGSGPRHAAPAAAPRSAGGGPPGRPRTPAPRRPVPRPGRSIARGRTRFVGQFQRRPDAAAGGRPAGGGTEGGRQVAVAEQPLQGRQVGARPRAGGWRSSAAGCGRWPAAAARRPGGRAGTPAGGRSTSSGRPVGPGNSQVGRPAVLRQYVPQLVEQLVRQRHRRGPCSPCRAAPTGRGGPGRCRPPAGGSPRRPAARTRRRSGSISRLRPGGTASSSRRTSAGARTTGRVRGFLPYDDERDEVGPAEDVAVEEPQGGRRPG